MLSYASVPDQTSWGEYRGGSGIVLPCGDALPPASLSAILRVLTGYQLRPRYPVESAVLRVRSYYKSMSVEALLG